MAFGISRLIRIALLSFILVPVAMAVPVPHGSGTGLLIRRLNQLHRQGMSTLSARTADVQGLSGRTYLTLHFAIHYTLGPNIHHPRFTAADSSLVRQIGSILHTLPPSFTAYQRDSAVNAGFPDSVVPLYVLRAGVHYERTWSYYHDTLGMDMPRGGQRSFAFASDNDDGARYTVDVCDISTVYPEDGGATYGLTFPPPSFTLLENDFVYGASVDSTGQITGGHPIQAVLSNGQVLHDYSLDPVWDMGIKVTVAHEFSHAVHLNYAYSDTSVSASNFHDWYELSATAMEEVLAPEVNDYFQYLPCIFQKHQSVPLIDSTIGGYTAHNGICDAAPYYIDSYFGQGVFAQYLYRFVGKTFDKEIWSVLRTNGNNLPAALKTSVQFYGKNWDSVYSAYTALFAAAGRSASAASCTDSAASIFTRDLPCWPVPSLDPVPAASKSLSDVVPPLTFRLFAPPVAPSSVRLNLTGLGEAVAQSVPQSGTPVPLGGNPVVFFSNADGATLCLTLPNASFSQSGSVLANTSPQGFAAFPDPVSPGGSVSFVAPVDSGGPVLIVVSESGRRVAELSLASDGWVWNLRDEQGRAVPSGVYYYSVPGRAPKSLLVLPH